SATARSSSTTWSRSCASAPVKRAAKPSDTQGTKEQTEMKKFLVSLALCLSLLGAGTSGFAQAPAAAPAAEASAPAAAAPAAPAAAAPAAAAPAADAAAAPAAAAP